MAQKDILPKRFYKKGLFYLVVAILAVGGILTTLYIQNVKKTDEASQTQTTTEVKVDPEYITYVATAGKTSLDQLKEVNSTVVTTSSTWGDFVDTVNGLKGGTDGKYWTFYIDGEMASVGAGSYTQKGGEKIEWKFVNLQ